MIDLTVGRFFPTAERLESLNDSIRAVESAASSPAEAWLGMLGLLAGLVDVVPLCRLRRRPLHFHLLSFFRPVKRDLLVPVPLRDPVLPHLWWTLAKNVGEGIPFGIWRQQLSVTTDASLTGWGAFCNFRTPFSGVWTAEEAQSHINLLELEAVVRAVKALADVAAGKSLTTFSDNTSSVAYINRQGGTRSPDLCLETWFFLLWCRDRDIQVRTSHLTGVENTLADKLSRGRVSQGEWERVPQWANYLFKRLGRPLVDLFATAENAKLPTFCSRGFDPRAWATDALSFSWDGLDSYAFPPFSMIHSKIRASMVRVLLITPLWPRFPWFSAPTPSASRTTCGPSRPSRPSLTGQGPSSTPTGSGSTSYCLEAVRDSLTQGLPEDIASLAAGSRKPSSFRNYDSRMSRFRKWCSENQASPTSASLEQVSRFCKCLFDKSKQVSTIKNYRSAIAAVHKGFPDGSYLGDNPILTQLVKDMGNARPVVRALTPSWSINQVFRGSGGCAIRAQALFLSATSDSQYSIPSSGSVG